MFIKLNDYEIKFSSCLFYYNNKHEFLIEIEKNNPLIVLDESFYEATEITLSINNSYLLFIDLKAITVYENENEILLTCER